MDVYWLEQSAADLPAQNDWLSASDRTRLNAMRFEKRRDDWRLGRWTAKLAVAAYLDLPTDLPALAEIEIRPAPSGAPEVFLANQPAEVTISLSHRDGMAICAVAASGVALGCDLEIVEPRSDAFVTRLFHAGRTRVGRPGTPRGPLSTSRSALERQGERAQSPAHRPSSRHPIGSRQPLGWVPNKDLPRSHEDPRESPSPSWLRRLAPACMFACGGDQLFQGWWQHEQNLAANTGRRPIPFAADL